MFLSDTRLIFVRLCRDPLVTVAAERQLGEMGASAGARGRDVSLTHEAGLKHDWEAGEGAEMHCVSFLLAGRGCVSPRWAPAGGTGALLCSALPSPGTGAQLGGGGMGGGGACPGHSAEHVFPAERRRVPSSCRVTLQSAGHGCAGGSHGQARGALPTSPFLVLI